MKKSFLGFVLCILIFGGCTNKKISRFDFTGPRDPSLIRGFNYTPAGVASPRHHVDTWVKYDSATIEFDLDLAKSLNLNQVRVFVPYQVYLEDSVALPGKLKHFTQECYKRGIGVMPVLQAGPWVRDTTQRAAGRNWARFLVNALSDEPGLAMWDVMNEPDYPPVPERVRMNFENCKFMTKAFHELDPTTPVTIGMAFVQGMIDMADYVDVLQFHDYMQTRSQIRDTITRAKEFAAKAGKPLINGEIGCIARANPYDITLQEHMDAKVGWYIWELMIVRQGWGNVHGVFYEDGTVRDPSIAAAIMGFFRKRTSDILPAVADQEGWVTRIIERSDKWLAADTASWKEGMFIAETAANLLEAGELTAMRIPPTYEVEMLRKSEGNIDELKQIIIKFRGLLEPYKKPVVANK
ncbi:MAG TPA: glycoside hydrolase family 2 TIM barrel-domain containing protein [Bacteroidales bacterium]|nr:glycoside hydrolase family 2 TIM barrel-domain containing protein [Bacteroidales bacterium]